MRIRRMVIFYLYFVLCALYFEKAYARHLYGV